MQIIDNVITDLQNQSPALSLTTSLSNVPLPQSSSISSMSSSMDSTASPSPVILPANSTPPVQSVGVRAIMNPPDCSYLLTAGDDKRIRFWNIQNPNSSFTICGLPSDQPKPKYGSIQAEGGNVQVYQELPNPDAQSSSANISKLRGPSAASTNHHESILDIKVMEYPHRMLISAGRDGVIKVWK